MAREMPADKTPSMKEGGWNDGRMKDSAHAGQTIFVDYGLDRSSKVGSATIERDIAMGGSATDLSHSLSGAGAKQEKNDGGRKSTIKEA